MDTRSRAGSSSEAHGQEGFTFLEATLSTAILAIGFLALWGTLIYCQRSNQAAEQKKKALDAAAARIEFLKSQPFDTLVATFGPAAGADANRFSVPTLDSEIGQAHGRMLLYFDETNPTGETGLGLPRDLNGDGDAADTDVSADFRILPVRVRVAWNGPLGEQQVELRTLLRRED